MKVRSPILLWCLFFATPLCAHPPEFENEGTNAILGTGSTNRTIFGDNYGGYGYLANSEAEAHEQLQFSCDDKSQKQYVSTYCHGQAMNFSADPTADAHNLVNDTMRSVVLYRLRTHASEYLALNMRSAAGSLGKPVTLARPECISEDSPSWKAAMVEHPRAATKLGAKLEAVSGTLQGENMAKALLYGERLEYGSQANNCESGVAGGRAPGCTAIQHASYRLRTSFPALYSFAVQGTVNNPMALARKTDHYEDFRNSLMSLMGAHNAETLSIDEAKARGAHFLEAGVSAGPYRDLENRLQQALAAAENEPPTSILGKAMQNYKKAVRDLQSDHFTRMKQELANLCKNKFSFFGVIAHERINIYNMAIQHPNVIRQTMLDMAPSERALTAAVLCDVGAIPPLQRDPQCDGVSGGPLPDNDISVGRRKINDWPSGSQNYFTMTKAKSPPSAPINIKLNINFALGPSLAGLSSAVLEQKLQAWQDDINAWANCSVGAVPTARLNTSNTGNDKVEKSCPLSPGMRGIDPKIAFQITMRPTTQEPPPPPSVQLHQCYRLDVPGTTNDRSNCDKIKELHINKCITEHPDLLAQCLQSGANEGQCRLNVKEFCHGEIEQQFTQNPESFNRADSSNYSLNDSFSTMRHEVFHQMGLADEYYSDERPYSLLGEHDSIMRNSHSLDARLYPRHASQILDVLRCPAVSGASPE